MCDTYEIIDLSGGIFIALFTEFGAASAPEEEVQCQWSSRRTSAKGERERDKEDEEVRRIFDRFGRFFGGGVVAIV